MDRWQTYTFEFTGGLITNLSPQQQGTKAPGSARILTNFEPSISGGYRRVEGYEKYDSSYLPPYGYVLVQGSGQTGATLNIANIFESPEIGDVFSITGVDGTYVVTAATYDAVNNLASVTVSPELASSPADKAPLVFENETKLVRGCAAWHNTVFAYRGGVLHKSDGNGWTVMNKPSYGVLSAINGAGQTGSTVNIDGLSGSAPKRGDTFIISGVEKVYTVASDATVTSGAASISIVPALASSPADNATITWLTSDFSEGSVFRFDKYNVGGVDKLVGVNGASYPFTWDGQDYVRIDGSTDLIGAAFVVFFKNQLFFAKNNVLYFSAPYTDNDFTAANGAGVIAVDGTITGLIVFRETLFIFTERNISQLTGNTAADFVLKPVTRNVGCVAPNTIQEVGGDVMFLGPEGLRLLSATDRIGDFNLGLVSKPIQDKMIGMINKYTSFSSTIIKEKSQYRLFGYSETIHPESTLSIIGVQKSGQDTSMFEWSEVVGMKAFASDEDYYSQREINIFCNDDGYVYKMESGNSFDGENIRCVFATPYVSIDDPRVRKTFYKLFLYTDPQGGVDIDINLKFDFDTQDTIQPDTVNVSNEAGSVSFYGAATYGGAAYGAKLTKLFLSPVVGSGLNVSLEFRSDNQKPPFSFDAATLEYSSHDRR